MIKYNGAVVLKWDDIDSGNAGALKTITVRNTDGSKAPIFSDDSGTVLANPFLTDTNGNYGFWVEAGVYNIVISEGQADQITIGDEPIATGGNVESVFGRDGVVEAESGDYDAILVDYDPSSSPNITAVEVQNAIQQLANFANAIDVPVESVFGRIGAIVSQSGDYQGTQIDYDNTGSGLTATNVQAAIDELKILAGVQSIYGRQGVVVALSGDYDAVQVDYDPSSTPNVSAVEVQTAIEQLATYASNIDVPVQSVFGRIGQVAALAGDYTAAKIDLDPASFLVITDTNVQDGMESLEQLIAFVAQGVRLRGLFDPSGGGTGVPDIANESRLSGDYWVSIASGTLSPGLDDGQGGFITQIAQGDRLLWIDITDPEVFAGWAQIPTSDTLPATNITFNPVNWEAVFTGTPPDNVQEALDFGWPNFVNTQNITQEIAGLKNFTGRLQATGNAEINGTGTTSFDVVGSAGGSTHMRFTQGDGIEGVLFWWSRSNGNLNIRTNNADLSQQATFNFKSDGTLVLPTTFASTRAGNGASFKHTNTTADAGFQLSIHDALNDVRFEYLNGAGTWQKSLFFHDRDTGRMIFTADTGLQSQVAPTLSNDVVRLTDLTNTSTGYVTINTAQTITGQKTFTATRTVANLFESTTAGGVKFIAQTSVANGNDAEFHFYKERDGAGAAVGDNCGTIRWYALASDDTTNNDIASITVNKTADSTGDMVIISEQIYARTKNLRSGLSGSDFTLFYNTSGEHGIRLVSNGNIVIGGEAGSGIYLRPNGINSNAQEVTLTSNLVSVKNHMRVNSIDIGDANQPDWPYLYQNSEGGLSLRVGQTEGGSTYRYWGFERSGAFKTTQAELSASAPTAANHATRKDYVDGLISDINIGNYVDLTSNQTIGGLKTFNQNLTLAAGNPYLKIKATTNTNNAHINFENSDGSSRGLIYFSDASEGTIQSDATGRWMKFRADGGVQVDNYFYAGRFYGSGDAAVFGTETAGSVYLRPNGAASSTNQIQINSNGNILANAAPVNDNHLTNKLYVDNQVTSASEWSQVWSGTMSGDTSFSSSVTPETGYEYYVWCERSGQDESYPAYFSLPQAADRSRKMILPLDQGTRMVVNFTENQWEPNGDRPVKRIYRRKC